MEPEIVFVGSAFDIDNMNEEAMAEGIYEGYGDDRVRSYWPGNLSREEWVSIR